ncbi:hypothetical protein L596_005863 [Steinernema carpocapsae]|uniref:Uncharacterized protein n=1 Tax=Steinernema carpocapsae TaxID=34508 RepID=A0A4U8V1T7_STECR|nr:hypothetical protein L596_005863 [Steinernema carpocapsae]
MNQVPLRFLQDVYVFVGTPELASGHAKHDQWNLLSSNYSKVCLYRAANNIDLELNLTEVFRETHLLCEFSGFINGERLKLLELNELIKLKRFFNRLHVRECMAPDEQADLEQAIIKDPNFREAMCFIEHFPKKTFEGARLACQMNPNVPLEELTFPYIFLNSAQIDFLIGQLKLDHSKLTKISFGGSRGILESDRMLEIFEAFFTSSSVELIDFFLPAYLEAYYLLRILRSWSNVAPNKKLTTKKLVSAMNGFDVNVNFLKTAKFTCENDMHEFSPLQKEVDDFVVKHCAYHPAKPKRKMCWESMPDYVALGDHEASQMGPNSLFEPYKITGKDVMTHEIVFCDEE